MQYLAYCCIFMSFIRTTFFFVLVLFVGLSQAAPPPGKIVRIGYLSTGSARFAELKAALNERGFVEGKNVVYEGRWGELGKLDELAAELVATRPDVIMGITTPAVAALQRATRTIPIVIMFVSDPVGAGFAQTLSRPGGNITGASDLQDGTMGKLLELSLAMSPGKPVGVLSVPENPRHEPDLKLLQSAAQKLRRPVRVYPSRDPEQLESVFSAAARDGVRVMIVLGGAPHDAKFQAVLDAANRHRIGTAHIRPLYARRGALFAYGLEHKSYVQDVVSIVDRVVNGSQPALMPITQPTQFELVINGGTAQRLGLSVPPAMSITAITVD